MALCSCERSATDMARSLSSKAVSLTSDGLGQKVRDGSERTAKYDCSASALSSVSMMLLRAPLLLGAAWEAAASAADALHCMLLLRLACCRLAPPMHIKRCCHNVGSVYACMGDQCIENAGTAWRAVSCQKPNAQSTGFIGRHRTICTLQDTEM